MKNFFMDYFWKVLVQMAQWVSMTFFIFLFPISANQAIYMAQQVSDWNEL